jgi:trimeric autotransporter adhesin
MRHFNNSIVVALATLLLLVSISSAQQTSTTAVPNLVRYSGTLKDAQGAALSSSTAVGVTFSIYKQQDGGASVWMETQNVTPDAIGQYSVVLGSTTSTGLPDDLFLQQEQRWLGVQVQGQAEQARVLLVSVPYAFKAHEAETLGGLPASAFVKAPPTDASGGSAETGSTAVNAGGAATSSKTAPTRLLGTPGYIPIWLGGTSFINSTIYQNASTGLGIGTMTPNAKVDVVGDVNIGVGTSYNIYRIGYHPVLSSGTPGAGNLYVGEDAGANSGNFGGFNTFVGFHAGFTNFSGLSNTFSGYNAGLSNRSGSGNTFFGASGGTANINGNNNTFLGELAGQRHTGGNNNIFLGDNAGGNNTTGQNDIDIGNAGCPLPCTENNTIRIGQGHQATYIAGIFGNTPSGASLVVVNAQGQLGTTTGLVPPGSPYYIQNGTLPQPSSNFNISGNGTAGGTLSAAAGYQIGANNVLTIGGANNLFVGVAAGQAITLGRDNTFSGAFAGSAVTTGSYNTYSGSYAGSLLSVSDGEPGEARTPPVIKAQSVGTFNTAFGSFAGTVPVGVFTTTTKNNIDIGFRAGYGRSSGDNNINVGYQVCPNPSEVCPENSTIHIGNDTDSSYPQQNAAYIAGIFASTATPAAGDLVVCVQPTGELYGAPFGMDCAMSSSRRFKENILDMDASSSKLFQLRPVTFFYKPQYDDGTHLLQYGLIAEEVAKVYPEMAAYDKDGQPYGVRYQMLTPMLLNELQKQHKVVTAQQDELQTQLQQIKTQQQQMQAQRHEIDGLKLQLRQQNASLQERLTKLESYVATQMKSASDNPPRTTPGANGGLQ